MYLGNYQKELLNIYMYLSRHVEKHLERSNFEIPTPDEIFPLQPPLGLRLDTRFILQDRMLVIERLPVVADPSRVIQGRRSS